MALLVLDLWRTKRKPTPGRPVFRKPPGRPVSWQLVLIIASVILIACSMYGAIRLETASQLNSDVQLGAQVTKSASDTALSVHVTASKVRNIGYIGIYVLGLPSTVHMADVCSRFTTLIHRGRCTDIPCAYLGNSCEHVMDGTVTPDAAGDINETLTASLITGKFQDIYVQAVVCSSEGVCQKVSQAGSRLDIHL